LAFYTLWAGQGSESLDGAARSSTTSGRASGFFLAEGIISISTQLSRKMAALYEVSFHLFSNGNAFLSCGAWSLEEFRVMKYRLYLEPDEDGVLLRFVRLCLDAFPRGRTRTEATANIREASEGCLKSHRKYGDSLPPSIL
jgi:predicted RNase H-like HicB family nuclease